MKAVLTPLFLLSLKFIFSQNSPGGVSTGLQTWLRADIGVTGSTPATGWTNQVATGTAINLNGAPNLNSVATSYNYNPYIDFLAPVGTLSDGIAANRQCLRVAGFNDLNGLQYTSLFFSFHLTDLSRVNTHIATLVGVTGGSPPNGTLHGDQIGPNAAVNNGGYDPADFGAGAPANTWQRNGGNIAFNSAHSINKHILSASCISGGSSTLNAFLGGQNDNGGSTFQGHPRDWRGPAAEIIGYTSAISVLDRQKIHSYLGVKYGTTLSTDYLSTTGGTIFVTAAPYNLNIIGIGRDDIEILNQKQSHNDDDLVRIYLNNIAPSNALNTGTFASDLSYVMTGANADALTPTPASNAEVPVSCGITSRIAREWKVTRTNMSQNFSMDIQSPSWNSCMYFLVDDDGNFANGGTDCYFNGDGTGIVLSNAAGTITVANISTLHIPDNIIRFVTLGSNSAVSQFIFGNACVNNLVQFTNQSIPVNATYEWDFGDGSPISTALDPSHTYIAAGTYDVTLTVDFNGCVSISTQTVTIFPNPIINAGLDVSVCQGNSITLSASGGLNYVWNDPIVINNVPFIPTANGSYTVTGTDINGCEATDQVNLTLTSIVINGGPDVTICENETVTLSGSGGNAYIWNLGVVNTVPFSPINTQTYTVTGTDANGCSGTDQVLITVQAAPNVNAGPDQTICVGTSITLAGTGAINYLWDNGVTNGVSFTPATTQTYSVTGTDALGCTNIDQTTITVEIPVAVNFTAPIVSGCAPITVNFNNNSIVPAGANCIWNFGDGTTSTQCASAQHLYDTPGCYDVSLTITTATGCVWSTSITDYICVYAIPVANFSPNPDNISSGDVISQMVNSSTNASEYIWNFGDGTTSTEVEPIHSFLVDDNIDSYEVQLIANSGEGCSDTISRIIKVLPLLVYYVPNTFTPDGNELNQTFQPIFTAGFDPLDFSMTIYNRWGETIFETLNDKIGWDGTYGGKIVQSGVYTWKIEFKTLSSDERKVLHGHVNLLK